jgi:hypothetical protein
MDEPKKIKFWVEILTTDRMSEWTDDVPGWWDQMPQDQKEEYAADALDSLLGNYINIGYELPTD